MYYKEQTDLNRHLRGEDMSINQYYPESAEKLNWGALLLTPIWSLVHGKPFVALLSLVPVLGFGVSIYACIKGGHWAWDSKKWETELHFDESVSKWNVAGFIVLVVLTLLRLAIK